MPTGSAVDVDRPTRSQGIQSVEIGYVVLKALAEAGRPLGLSTLADIVGMPAAKVHRYVSSLVRCGLIIQERFMGQYDLGPSALMLGVHALSRLDPHQVVYDQTKVLGRTLDQSIIVSVWTPEGPIVTNYHASTRSLAIIARPGVRLPVIHTATGRLFLAFGYEDCLMDFWKLEYDPESPPVDDRTPLDIHRFRDLIADTRQRRMARTKGALSHGVHVLAAPILDMWGKAIMVIAIMGNRDLNLSWTAEPAVRLSEAAARISESFGYVSSAGSLRKQLP